MATISPTVVRATDERWATFTWEDVTESDTAASLRLDGGALSLVAQSKGTFGSATMTLEGSLDDTTFFGLNDLAGSAISHTAAAMDPVQSDPLYIKPVFAGGSSQSMTVILFARFLN